MGVTRQRATVWTNIDQWHFQNYFFDKTHHNFNLEIASSPIDNESDIIQAIICTNDDKVLLCDTQGILKL